MTDIKWIIKNNTGRRGLHKVKHQGCVSTRCEGTTNLDSL